MTGVQTCALPILLRVYARPPLGIEPAASVAEIARTDVRGYLFVVYPKRYIRQILVIEIRRFRTNFQRQLRALNLVQLGGLIAEPVCDLPVGCEYELRVEPLGHVAVVAERRKDGRRRAKVKRRAEKVGKLSDARRLRFRRFAALAPLGIEK